MRANLFSDLHVEHSGGDITPLIPTLIKSCKADVVILAGDIISLGLPWDQVAETFCFFSYSYEQIIYVPGNHEHYGSSPQAVAQVLVDLEAKFPNLRVLRNDFFEYQGQRFFGGTMWFTDKNPMWPIYRSQLNDFRCITDFLPWVFETNREFHEALQQVQEGDVVVTHHLPSMMSVPEDYRGDGLNIFYVSDCETEILEKKPKMWLHGHTHSQNDYQIADTRIVSNPLGYPGERSNWWFRKNLVLDI